MRPSVTRVLLTELIRLKMWTFRFTVLALAGGEPVGEVARGARQPAVGEGLAEYLRRHLDQLHEIGAEPVEVRDREEGVRVRREDGLLLGQVGGTDRENRAVRRLFVAEPLDVRLAERALPGECLAVDLPRPVGLPVLVDALSYLGHAGGQACHVVEGLHPYDGTPSTSVSSARAGA